MSFATADLFFAAENAAFLSEMLQTASGWRSQGRALSERFRKDLSEGEGKRRKNKKVRNEKHH